MVKFGGWRKSLYRWVVRLRATPHAIARGMALGVAFGVTMPPGLQLCTGLPVAWLLGGNLVAFAAGTLVSNPVTYVPLYYFTCRMGEVFLRLCGADLRLGTNLKGLIGSVLQVRLSGTTSEIRAVLACWLAGGLLVGLAFSVPVYYLTYLLAVEVHKLAEFSRSRRARRRVDGSPPQERLNDSDGPPTCS